MDMYGEDQQCSLIWDVGRMKTIRYDMCTPNSKTYQKIRTTRSFAVYRDQIVTEAELKLSLFALIFSRSTKFSFSVHLTVQILWFWILCLIGKCFIWNICCKISVFPKDGVFRSSEWINSELIRVFHNWLLCICL